MNNCGDKEQQYERSMKAIIRSSLLTIANNKDQKFLITFYCQSVFYMKSTKTG